MESQKNNNIVDLPDNTVITGVNGKTTISNTALKQQRKKRQTMENRIHKMHSKFVSERYQHYQNKLNTLQIKLTAMHELNNEDVQFNRMNRDLEEGRDLELVKLRLYEEYRISRVNKEFQQDIEEAKLEYEKIVTNLKKKLFENVENQIKSLQEEKILLDVANEKNYSMDEQAIADMKQTFNDDILTYNKTRSGKGNYINTGSNDDLKAAFITAAAAVNKGENYDSMTYHNDNVLSNLSDGFLSDNNNNAVTSDDLLSGLLSGGTNDIKRSLRRRIATKSSAGRHQDENGDDDYNGSATPDHADGKGNKTNNSSRKRRNGDNKKNGNNNRDEEEELVISPEWLYEIQKYDPLRRMLMDGNNPKGGDLNFHFSLLDNNTGFHNTKNSHTNTRKYERKQIPKTAPKLQGLDKEEVTEDLNLIRKLTGKKELPY
ncbi:hypothetical protein ACO0SA_001354 [Hanseniaspora valbyensis]